MNIKPGPIYIMCEPLAPPDLEELDSGLIVPLGARVNDDDTPQESCLRGAVIETGVAIATVDQPGDDWDWAPIVRPGTILYYLRAATVNGSHMVPMTPPGNIVAWEEIQ